MSVHTSLKRFSCESFRNLQATRLEFSPDINIFHGDNGQGKTNLLEAIALCTSLKPLRAVKQTSELICFGQPQATLHGTFQPHDWEISLTLEPQGKRAQINDKAIRSADALFDKVAVVTFVPDDLQIVFGGSANRRRAIDQLASSLIPSYSAHYRQYEKALTSRNHLLRSWPLDNAELDSFTQVLVSTGTTVITARNQAIEACKGIFEETFTQISSKQLGASIHYKPNVATSDFSEQLAELAQEERARKQTLSGPHLDDLDIEIDCNLARRTASRGQARALVLSLKIAHIQTIFQKRGIAPILLLDDVIGELDVQHATRLLEVIDHVGTQTFITTTHLDILPQVLQHHRNYFIHAGAVN